MLDTDLGTDVDDLLALAMWPLLAGAGLAAITTVYGDTELRARIASVACAVLGLSPRIVAGERMPLSGKRVLWAGHEGDGIAGLDGAAFDTSTDAVTLLTSLAAEHPGSLEIFAIGPLTNVAAAVLADPDFAGRVARLYVMGGNFDASATRPEHNFSSDAVATWIVLHAGIPTTICGYEITTQVVLGEADIDRIERSGPAGPLLADQTRRFWAWRESWASPGERHTNSPHDPMAVLTAFRPELFTFEGVQVGVVGRSPPGGAGGGGGAGAGAVSATPDPASHIQIVREMAADEVKGAVLAALATGAR